MVPAKNYGALNDENQWTGLIGMIAKNEIDFSLMDQTILKSRTEVNILECLKGLSQVVREMSEPSSLFGPMNFICFFIAFVQPINQ